MHLPKAQCAVHSGCSCSAPYWVVRNEAPQRLVRLGTRPSPTSLIGGEGRSHFRLDRFGHGGARELDRRLRDFAKAAWPSRLPQS